MKADAIPTTAARRLLMAGAGLLDDPGGRATAPAVYGLIERLGFVQVDSIHIVERAHHHILWTRSHAYRPAILTRLHEKDRRLFEHWTHDASVIPAVWLPHWRPRWERYEASKWFRERLGPERDRIVAHVLERITKEGPLPARVFEREPGGKSGWWEWAPSKAALEYLWRTGRLAVARREGFQKVYDLMERTHPEVLTHGTPSWDAHVQWACRTAMDRLGAATASEVAAFWRAVPIADAAAWCAAAAKRGELVHAALQRDDGGKPLRGYALADWRERLASLPEPPGAMRPLSPFDPIIRDRKRALRLFGFDYTFEAFTPAPKRKYGYYVLPILEGDRLVGRLDPRLDRDAGVLEVTGPWWVRGVERTKARRAALEASLDAYAAFVGADRWKIRRRRRGEK